MAEIPQPVEAVVKANGFAPISSHFIPGEA